MRRWHSWHIAVIALSLCAGCGGSVMTGNASTGGAPGSGAPSGGSGGTYSGGAQGGDGGGGVVGGCGSQSGGSTCKETYFHVQFSIVTPNGLSYSCYPGSAPDGGTPGQANWSTTGIVQKASPNFIMVDSCPPDANCAPELSTISVMANGLALSIPVGAIVSVDFVGPDQTEQIYSPCSGQLFIKSVGNWGGAHDPKGDGFLYLAAVDGSFAQPAGVPYKVALAKLACSTYTPGGVYAATGDYAFRFYSSPSFSDLVVHMGETQFLVTPKQKLHVRNLRSFEQNGTDSNWDWAYWVAP